MPDIPIGGGSGPGVVLDTIIGIHNARKGPPSGVPEQPGYRGPGDVIYDQRQAGATLEDVVGSGILDTPYAPAPSEQPVVPVEIPPSVPAPYDAYAPPPPIEGEVVAPPDTYHDYEGYYDPATEPAPEYNSGVTVEGEYTRGPDVQSGIDRKSPPARERVDDILTRIGGSIVGRVIGRVIGVASGPIGTVIQEVITPETLPPEPDMRGVGMPHAPAPVMSTTPSPEPYAGRAPTRPPAPQLPPVPRPPTVSAPTPDIGDVKPWQFDPQPPMPATRPSSPSAPPTPSTPNTFPPQPSTSSQPGSRSNAPPQSSPAGSPSSPSAPSPGLSPWWLIAAPIAAGLLRPGTRTGVSTATLSPVGSPSAAVAAPTPSVATASPVNAPSVVTAPGSAPPLTPIKPALLESAPAGDYCETPKQQRERRKEQRDNCERFITVTVPRHKRRVCAAEAGKLIGKKLGKLLGRKIGEELGLRKPRKPKAEGKGKKRRKKEEPLIKLGRKGRSVELPGGFGVEIPKPFRTKLPTKTPGVPRP